MLKSVGVTAIGSSAILGSGALTQLSSAKAVSVNVTADNSSIIELKPSDAVSDVDLIKSSGGKLTFSLTDINADSQLVIGDAPNKEPENATINSAAFKIKDTAGYNDTSNSNTDFATGIDVSVSSTAGSSGLGLRFLPTAKDDLYDNGTTGYTDTDQDSVAGANLQSGGTDIPSLPNKYKSDGSPNNDSARFLLDQVSTVGAELLLQADAADLSSAPDFDIVITAQPVEVSPFFGNPFSVSNTVATPGVGYADLSNEASESVDVTDVTSNGAISIPASTPSEIANGNTAAVASGGTASIDIRNAGTTDDSPTLRAAYASDQTDVKPLTVPSKPSDGVARWTLDDLDTDNQNQEATDVWGSNTGSMIDSSAITTGVNGKAGEAWQLAGGNNEMLELPELITDTSGFAMSLWMNPKDTSYSGTLITNRNDSNDGGFLVNYNGSSGDSAFKFYIDDPQSGWEKEEMSTSAWSDDQYNHIVFSYNGSNETMDAYVNYDGTSGTTKSLSATYQNNSTPIYVGGDGYSGGGMAGKYDDIRFYDRELTDTEVANLYSNGGINLSS